MLVASGCGGSQSSTGALGLGKAAQPVITPDPRLGQAKDSDLAKAEAQVGADCQTTLANHDFENAAKKMGQVASGGGGEGEKAIARVCEAAAKANMQNFRGALESVDEAKQATNKIHRSLRPLVEELLCHTEYVSAAAAGDHNRAQEALACLKELGRNPNVYIKHACMVAPDPTALPECATATSSPAAQAVITSDPRLGQAKGRGDLAKAEAQVGVDCQAMLANHDFEDAAKKMGQVASGGGGEGEKAIARVCKAAAEASMRKFSRALNDVNKAKRNLDKIHPALRPLAEELLYHTEYVSAAAVGDESRTEAALSHLKELGRDPSAYARGACTVASDPAALPECAAVTPSVTTPGSPSAEPETPVTSQPEDSRTEPTEESTSTESPAEETSEPPGTENGGPHPTES
ncbi:hypothetical protein SAMN05444920_106439 [Nonomuraea solani]|uniref:Uncharacterized protein n=2 Tax=Nonomuraea solani TaxID=1144553 RepID=A0A1H6DWB5_9ACTN|nr:hypothetical protein SAMN05444920_106439 [Nonomuraea solani]